MKRCDDLPAEFGDWLRSMSKDEVRRRLGHSITQRAATAGLSLDSVDLAAREEELEESYFACQEDGKEEEAMRLFKQARLLAAQRFLVDGADEEALYEFFHSLDDATPEAAIAALQTPNSTSQPWKKKSRTNRQSQRRGCAPSWLIFNVGRS
jgi:hypothetical protein